MPAWLKLRRRRTCRKLGGPARSCAGAEHEASLHALETTGTLRGALLQLCPRGLARLGGGSRGLRAAVGAELPRLARWHGLPAAGSLEVIAVAALAQAVGDVFFERASDVLRSDSEPVIDALAALLSAHRRCRVFVAGHCGRGCPSDFAPSFTRMRGKAVLRAVVERAGLRGHVGSALLLDHERKPRLFYCGCAASVAARDIAHAGATPLGDAHPRLDFSKAEVRVELVHRGADQIVEYQRGRRWWLAQPGGAPALHPDGPDWIPFNELDLRECSEDGGVGDDSDGGDA
ncbi:unnamed protein product [Prorocentrum cordatum]|uniref:Uncharacterized protein n=1 Tax=Prorocentrum cordatum TaxID=2364126 RepID=A0ABN9U986_9DINO|nr:unnamed protein product [Polarella glacialis]